MSAIETVSAVCAACGALFTLLLLTGVLSGGNLRLKLYRCYLVMVALSLAGCLIELLLLLCLSETTRETAPLGRILVYLDNAFGCAIRAAFAVYIFEYMHIKTPISQKPLNFVLWLEAALLLLLLLTAARFLPVPGWLNDFSHMMLLPFVSVTASVAAAMRHRKLLPTQEWVSLLFYLLITAVCYAAEASVHGLWIAYFGSAVAMFIIYVNIQSELGRRLKEQELAMAESRAAAMLSQIQPHFLSNALTAIEDLCDRDIGQAKEALNDFAHYLRGNIASLGQREMIPFEDELEHVRTYLALEKLRFRDRLGVVYDVEAGGFSLPPLTVQPIAENAVRHGIMKKEGGGTVTVRLRMAESARVITVEDDGVGFSVEAAGDGRAHIGIQNVRERLRLMCGGTLEIKSVPGLGTKAVITIPDRKEAAR